MKIPSILILLPFVYSSHNTHDTHHTNEKTMLRRNKSEDDYLDKLEVEETNYKGQLRKRIYNNNDKSKIWSIEPRMDIIPDNISEKEKNKLATGIFFSSFALSFPLLYLLNNFFPNSEL